MRSPKVFNDRPRTSAPTQAPCPPASPARSPRVKTYCRRRAANITKPSVGTTSPVQQTDAPGPSAASGAHCDDAGASSAAGALLLEPLFADVVSSLSDEMKDIVSKSLKSYDAIVSKESRRVYENQMRIQGALDLINKSQSEIRQSQLSIELAKKFLVDDISSMLREGTLMECPLSHLHMEIFLLSAVQM